MSATLFDLSGKIAPVTGSSRGLGFEIARGVGYAGATIILNGREEKPLLKAAGTLGTAGLAVHHLPMDILDEVAIQRKIPEIAERLGPIDILVNNAGIQRRGKLEEFELDTWRELVDTNLTSAFLVSRQVVQNMILRKSRIRQPG